jgi:hypothetical protein
MAKQAMVASMVVLYGTTSEQVQNFLSKHPKDAKFSASVTKGDRPWESDTVYLKLSWSEEL